MLILKLLSKQNSLTIVGDLGQGIYSHKGIESWEKLIGMYLKTMQLIFL